jgi:hypothetical protein
LHPRSALADGIVNFCFAPSDKHVVKQYQKAAFRSLQPLLAAGFTGLFSGSSSFLPIWH